MGFLEHTKTGDAVTVSGELLYRALAVGDLPAAWLLARPFLEHTDYGKLSAATAFNCGLCLYRLKEYERALSQLKQAERSLGTPPELDISEKKLFFEAIKNSGKQTALAPLDPDAKGLERYVLIRIRWLFALCLICQNRRNEAEPIIRFLAGYQIEL